MANNALNYMKDILAAPLGELISSVGNGVAEAQAALDAGSLAQVLEIYREGGDEAIKKLREIGYQPTFYVIPETEVEAQVSMSLSFSEESSQGGLQANKTYATKLYASPMNASVTNKYNMSTQASAKLKFKIVPVPQPGDISDIRVLPNLVVDTEGDARSIGDAIALLEELGLQYSVEDATGYTYDTEDSAVSAALVESQSPDVDSDPNKDKYVRAGDVISLVPNIRRLPDFTGQGFQEAVDTLEALGLAYALNDGGGTTYDLVNGPQPPAGGTVQSQSPAASTDPTYVSVSDTVTLTISV